MATEELIFLWQFSVVFSKKHLTEARGFGIIVDGTFYFWSLKSVQRRADKCCKSTPLQGCHQCLISKNKKLQENVDAYN